ncbi:hypothetical protein QR665_04100 [Acinetobacter gerneri]|uniref:hypothetical protein n=1 Tax=Acinetobacter gerneri TaxID=202952 RepID=UPI0029359E86|nr:hypothetical protein [Acinetobacter gerneri]MDV2438680.1 hypothetical protein [Acinetobacter gerneri]
MTEINQNHLAQIEQSVTIDQIRLTERIGALKATEFVRKLVTVTTIKMLAEIKEAKQYKGLKIILNEELVTSPTWNQFCQHIGLSREKVDEDIRNLGVFGEDFLETSQRMSLGYRDLRKLRKLDDAEREIVINGEAVKTEDRESLIDLIEEMSAKHTKEKTSLKKKVEDLTADVDAKDKIIKTKDEKLNKQDTELTKLKSPPEIRLRAETEDQELEKAALETLKTESILLLNATLRYQNAINGVLDLANDKGIHQLFDRVDESVIATYQRIAQFTQTLGIQVDFENMVSPEWLFPQIEDASEIEASDMNSEI